MIIHHKYIKYSQHFGNLYNVTGHIELHSNELDTTTVVYLGVKIACNDLNIDESRTNLYKRQMWLIMMRGGSTNMSTNPKPNLRFVTHAIARIKSYISLDSQLGLYSVSFISCCYGIENVLC